MTTERLTFKQMEMNDVEEKDSFCKWWYTAKVSISMTKVQQQKVCPFSIIVSFSVVTQRQQTMVIMSSSKVGEGPKPNDSHDNLSLTPVEFLSWMED